MPSKRKHNLAIRKTPDGVEIAPAPASETLDLLKRMLEGMRVRTILAYKRGCCMACNFPHVMGVCRKNCACHEVKTHLEAHGIKVDI